MSFYRRGKKYSGQRNFWNKYMYLLLRLFAPPFSNRPHHVVFCLLVFCGVVKKYSCIILFGQIIITLCVVRSCHFILWWIYNLLYSQKSWYVCLHGDVYVTCHTSVLLELCWMLFFICDCATNFILCLFSMSSHPAEPPDLEVTSITTMSLREEMFPLEWPRDANRALLLDLFCLDF